MKAEDYSSAFLARFAFGFSSISSVFSAFDFAGFGFGSAFTFAGFSATTTDLEDFLGLVLP